MLPEGEGCRSSDLNKTRSYSHSQGEVGVLIINPLLGETTNCFKCVATNYKRGCTPPAPFIARCEVIDKSFGSRRNKYSFVQLQLVTKKIRLAGNERWLAVFSDRISINLQSPRKP